MIMPNTLPGKCCMTMSSATDYCDAVYTWCTYSYSGNSKYFMCPLPSTCDDVVSVSDNQWYVKTKTLQDGEMCVHRIKYDTIHMDETIYELGDLAGDTTFRYADIYTKGLANIEVRVRVTSSSAFIKAFYLQKYVETPPTSPGTFNILGLGTQYPLTINSPYITVMIYTNGGPSIYTLEYGRVDERDYQSNAYYQTIYPLLIALALIVNTLI
ncbi:UNKNOWN [Stylonychia lemnae]|uniref:Uncharacterized protein n=1 Tax=Stylonychia lemnae TaxID=5949 RepID=A0A077ZZX4_STYLE|nr:UNKNOWN [Stylonychia lemnae]|eukprot:CDW75450.1 UNKNOWN [Stylonychia lemnae]